MKAEHQASCTAPYEAIWLRWILEDLRGSQDDSTVDICLHTKTSMHVCRKMLGSLERTCFQRDKDFDSNNRSLESTSQRLIKSYMHICSHTKQVCKRCWDFWKETVSKREKQLFQVLGRVIQFLLV